MKYILSTFSSYWVFTLCKVRFHATYWCHYLSCLVSMQINFNTWWIILPCFQREKCKILIVSVLHVLHFYLCMSSFFYSNERFFLAFRLTTMTCVPQVQEKKRSRTCAMPQLLLLYHFSSYTSFHCIEWREKKPEVYVVFFYYE